MIVYDAHNTAHEAFLAEWWLRLTRHRELDRLFSGHVRSLSLFLAIFHPPITLLFEADPTGIWFAAWRAPFMDLATFSYWAREDRRHSKRSFRAGSEALSLFLVDSPVLVGFKVDERGLKIAQRYGFERVGMLPHVDGSDSIVVALKRERFTQWQAVPAATPR